MKNLIILLVVIIILSPTISFAEEVNEEWKINIETLRELNNRYNVISKSRDIRINDSGDIVFIKMPYINKYYKIGYEESLDYKELNELDFEINREINKVDNSIMFLMVALLILIVLSWMPSKIIPIFIAIGILSVFLSYI